ncbi:MAG: HD domain-containing protein [Desulfobacterales bacterium]|nr:HD domain-containing protein [Desulfobacterales bacterium]MDD4071172.1 HD domain-containing protein [Desulfobacterales bacterium]MDD4393362.1 HD domain-containing protein [Desulfobacterales bacterium]
MNDYGNRSSISLNHLTAVLNQREGKMLSLQGTLSTEAVRRTYEAGFETDYRQSFSLDVDRILHSLAYIRYIDKTQVFYLIKNDHLTHRVLHVQLVSKIARTIGRYLRLNEDLVEAIALGHDIGHAPFGHDGERILSKLCQSHGIGFFHHNVQSVQFLDKVERKGKGWNLCLQTIDGILCHDGEIHNQALAPVRGKRFETLDADIVRKKNESDIDLIPMTLEGCVVRMADTISYIGRDIEDAIRLGVIRRTDMPEEVVKVLGNTNGTIVYNLVTDVIRHSYDKDYITFSGEISEALKRLKAFNLERIYLYPGMKKHLKVIKTLFESLFETCLTDIVNGNRSSVIFSHYLENMAEDYIQQHRKEEIVRDFISGMTDRYFLSQCPAHLTAKLSGA